MRVVELSFDEGDFVTIDGCDSIKAVVLSACVTGNAISYQVAWMDGGQRKEWIESWRLSKWDA